MNIKYITGMMESMMKKKFIWIALAGILISSGGYFVMSITKSIDVELYTVKRGNVSRFIEETGVVKTEGEVQIYSAIPGKVVEVPVEVGEQVQEGQRLIKIDDKAISTNIKVLEAQKEQLIAQYSEAKKTLDRDEIRKLELQLEVANAALDEAQRLAENSKKLYDEGALSREEYKRALANLTTKEAGAETAKLEFEKAQNGISSNVRKQYESQILQIQLQIDDLNNKLKDYNIDSPINGTVLMKEVEVGSYIQPGMLMMEIGDYTQLYIESDILISEIGNVKEGAQVYISNSDIGIDSVKGTVSKIYPKAFSKLSDLGIEQKRVRIEIDLEGNIPAKLKPGYDVDIKIAANSSENALMIPAKAVLTMEGKNYVWINDNGTAALKEIKKGIEGEDNVEVIEGLQEGDEIVVAADEDIKEGARIK